MAEGGDGEDIWHGGDLAQAQALFPQAPAPWIDLSTGISPLSYPLPALPDSLWRRLPGSAEDDALLSAARRAYGVPDEAGVIAAPGTQILIELLPRLIAAGPVAVLGPTYAEHAAAWRKGGAQVAEVTRPDDLGAAGTIVLVNPNNPDGRILPRETLTALAAQCEARGGLLIIDEAFVDPTPEASLVPVLPPGALVLRSFGKSYGLAGLRVGFAIGARGVTQALRAALGPWAVSGPALRIAATALDDEGWRLSAFPQNRRAAARLDGLLARHGVIVGGTALFRLLATPHAPALFAHLGRNGIYVRRFQNDAAWLRFGLPGDDASWRRLEAALDIFAPA